jgi:hypothetical protein
MDIFVYKPKERETAMKKVYTMPPVQYRPTYLIQGLEKPVNAKRNPFSFGGGGSGLTTDAEELVSSVWSWRYMGAAEYEFGAVQKALSTIHDNASAGKMVATMVEIVATGKTMKDIWRRNGILKRAKPERTAVFVLCRADQLECVGITLNAIVNYAEIKYHGHENPCKVWLKRSIALGENLYDLRYQDNKRPLGDLELNNKRPLGGLELDNGWIFTYEEDDFKKVCALFGVEPDDRRFPIHVPQPPEKREK